jgi:hypothetical protein
MKNQSQSNIVNTTPTYQGKGHNKTRRERQLQAERGIPMHKTWEFSLSIIAGNATCLGESIKSVEVAF